MTQHPPHHPLVSPTSETLSDSARSHLVSAGPSGVELAWGSPQQHGFQIRAKGFTSDQLNALDTLLSEAHKTAEARWP
ncbi:MAG: hypothetical protein K2X01_10010 [Cyanobacteria bacterium]|nr:hypothetical protein [Cyanobacteriota bacterium]